MGSRVRLHARKDQHPCNARPKTVPFSLVIPLCDDSGILFYSHMTKNGHKIIVSTNPTKVALGARKNFSLDYFGRMITNLLGVSFEKNISNTFEDVKILLKILMGCYHKH